MPRTKHSLTGLLELARARGYPDRDIRRIMSAHWTALALSDGGYRPCGRPFLNHLIGTASVLVHYGFETRLVEAGLLHAAYSHAPLVDPPQAAAGAVMRALGGPDNVVERTVRAYTLRSENWRVLTQLENWQDVALMAEIDIAIVAIANAVDMHLSGEIRTTGRTDEDREALSKAAEICAVLGVPGLAATLAAQAVPNQSPAGRLKQAFRLSAGKPVPMVNLPVYQVLWAARERALTENRG